jgi:hypothetical protein
MKTTTHKDNSKCKDIIYVGLKLFEGCVKYNERHKEDKVDCEIIYKNYLSTVKKIC